MDVNWCRRARGVAVILSLAAYLLAMAAPTQSSASSMAGKRCFGSESAINDNLPLGQTSHATEISGIEGIFVRSSHEMVGLLYVTRDRTQFVQVSAPASLAQLLRRLNAIDLATQVAASNSGTYFQLPSRVAASLEQAAPRDVVLNPCVGTMP